MDETPAVGRRMGNSQRAGMHGGQRDAAPDLDVLTAQVDGAQTVAPQPVVPQPVTPVPVPRPRPASLSTTPAVSDTPYVDQDRTVDGKFGTLARVFGQTDTQAILTANGYDTKDEEMLAGVMGNEGGRNERRRTMVRATQSGAHNLASRLTKAGVDLTQLGTATIPPAVLEAMSEDDKAMLAAAQQGKVNLSAATAVLGDDATDAQKAEKQAALDTIGQFGIDRQVGLYGEARALAAKGKDATAEEKRRLAELRKRKVQGGGTFQDVEGLSDARFRALYDDNQSRFENANYVRDRRRVESWLKAGEKGDEPKIGSGNEDVSAFLARHPEVREGNYDALADIDTSWGTAQVMGHWGDLGKLKRQNGDTTYNMADLKASGDRLTPNATDVDMQIAYFRDVAGVSDPGGSTSADIATAYNGANWRAQNPHYANNLDTGRSLYKKAKNQRAGQ